MIFNLVVTTILIVLSFSGIRFQKSMGEMSQGDIKVSQKKEPDKIINRELSWESRIIDPLNQDEFFDLNQDGKLEKITIYSTLGKEIGDENTKIYINDSEKPALTLHGYFEGIEAHKMDPQNLKILEVRTTHGHSINTNFYTYKRGELSIMPVSTSKPPSFYGIVSRNKPEVKDADNDGTLELFAYYRHFPPEKKRTVEVYKFVGQGFIKTQEYEETLPTLYL